MCNIYVILSISLGNHLYSLNAYTDIQLEHILYTLCYNKNKNTKPSTGKLLVKIRLCSKLSFSLQTWPMKIYFLIILNQIQFISPIFNQIQFISPIFKPDSVYFPYFQPDSVFSPILTRFSLFPIFSTRFSLFPYFQPDSVYFPYFQPD